MSKNKTTIKNISNFSDFMALKQDWNRLATLTNSADIFLSHEWYEAAWAWLDDAATIMIITVSNHGVVTGICPILFGEEKKGIFKVKKLSLLVIPDSQQFDILCDPEQRDGVLNAIVGEICSNQRWDYFDIAKLKQESQTAELLREKFIAQGNKCTDEVLDESLCIGLDGSWDDYYKTRSRRLKKGNNYIKNVLARSEAKFEVKKFSAEQIDEKVFDDIVNISANSWKSHTGLTFDNAGPRKFLTVLLERMKEKDGVAIWFFYYENHPVAYELQLTYQNVVSALRSDYHVKHEDLSPGTYLNWKLLEQLFGEGLKLYNMGPGTNKYKLRWTNNAVSLSSFCIMNNRTIVGKWLGLWEITLKPLLKKYFKKKGTA